MPKKKKVTKKKSVSKKEKKIEIVGNYLNEIYHLAGHSIAAGEEAYTPLLEIAMIALYLHNDIEREKSHRIRGINIQCECGEKEHTLTLKEYEDTCAH